MNLTGNIISGTSAWSTSSWDPGVMSMSPFRTMKTTIRVHSRHDEHMTDEHVWPESLSPILPGVGDEIMTSRFGLRTVVKRHFTYEYGSDSNLANLVVDVICE